MCNLKDSTGKKRWNDEKRNWRKGEKRPRLKRIQKIIRWKKSTDLGKEKINWRKHSK